QNLDTRKEAMTIRHLLMMRSGLASNDFDVPFWRKSIPHNDFTFRTNASNEYPGTWINYLYPENDWTKLLNSSDWIQTSLDKPMDAEPGTTFTYSDNVGHLLAGIFQEKTGMIPEEFADQYLFGPLNITEYVWFKDPSGLNFGAGGLWLQPHDMLKFGYLYLNNGIWNNTQIIPEEWIEESTQDYNDFGYGYYWWINEGRSYYNADGLGGQRIYVKADEELVVAVTAWEGQISFTIDILFNTFILRAIIKDDTSTVVPTSTITSNTTTSSDVFSIGLGLVILFSISQRKERKT
ncbi:MAG: serine hydrolase domain-containing protein, partial [Promethearchaeota archaeon]